MKNDDLVVLKTVGRILTPFIFMFGLYIQFHGEYSPGGGFQAGVICASVFILHALIHGLDEVLEILPLSWLRILLALGVLLYAAVGVATLFQGGNLFEYSTLASDPHTAQQLGIIVIELGIGITVFSVMMIVFYLFAERSR